MKLSDILKDINVLVSTVSGDTEITGVCYDSRKVRRGDLFVAVRGYESDGHKYIAMAAEKGCAAVLCEDAPEGNIPYVRTDDSRLGLALAARNFYGDPSREMKVIGITGTNGKTTTSRMIEQAFADAGFRYFSNKSGANLLTGIIERLHVFFRYFEPCYSVFFRRCLCFLVSLCCCFRYFPEYVFHCLVCFVLQFLRHGIPLVQVEDDVARCSRTACRYHYVCGYFF